MKQILIILTILFFSACGGHIIKAPLVPKLQPYKATKIACDKMLKVEVEAEPTIFQECHTFLDSLYDVNAQFAVSRDKDSGNFTETRNNINFAKVNKGLSKTHQALLSSLPQESKKAMQGSNVELVKSFLNFPTQKMNLKYFEYFNKYPSVYTEAHFYINYKTSLATRYLKEAKVLYEKNKKHAAFKRLQLSAKLENREAMQLLAQRYLVNKKYNSALKWYKKLLNDESYAIHLEMAKIYETQKKYEKAFHYYQKSAITLDAFSEYKIYTLLKEKKVSPKEQSTEQWLARAARHGYVKAQFLYGLNFLDKNEPDDAKTWLLKAAQANYSDAYTPLGQLYFDQEQYSYALIYLTKASLNADSSYTLAYMYEHAKGTKRDIHKAYELYMQAQKMGIEKADIAQDILRVHTEIMRPFKEEQARIAKEKELKKQEEQRALLLAQQEKEMKIKREQQLALAAQLARETQEAKELASTKKKTAEKIAKLKQECPLPMTKRRFNYKMAGLLVGTITSDNVDGSYFVSVASANRKATYFVSGFDGEELYRGTEVHWRVQSEGKKYEYTAGNGAEISVPRLRFIPADHDPCSPYVKNTQE